MPEIEIEFYKKQRMDNLNWLKSELSTETNAEMGKKHYTLDKIQFLRENHC